MQADKSPTTEDWQVKAGFFRKTYPHKVAPECACEIASTCQHRPCCYYGEAVPENVRSVLLAPPPRGNPTHPRVRYLPTPSPRIGVTLSGTEHALSIRDAAELATAIFVVVGARGGAVDLSETLEDRSNDESARSRCSGGDLSADLG